MNRPSYVTNIIIGPKYAAKRGEFDIMQRLLGVCGRGIDWAPSSGWRCLHHAARAGNRTIKDWLVQQGAVDAPLPGTDREYPGRTAEQILAAVTSAPLAVEEHDKEAWLLACEKNARRAVIAGAMVAANDHQHAQVGRHKYAGVVLVTDRPGHGPCLVVFHNTRRAYEIPWGTHESKHEDLAATAVDELWEETCGLVKVQRSDLACAPTLHPSTGIHHAFELDNDCSRLWGLMVDFPKGWLLWNISLPLVCLALCASKLGIIAFEMQ